MQVVPSSLLELPLTSLSLQHCNLVEVTEIGRCATLESLNLTDNKLKVFPLTSLPKLTTLALSRNQLETLPKMPATLQTLSLAHNQFLAFPASLLALPLEDLNLGGNCLLQLPCEISQMKQLRCLNVDHNRLKKLPSSFQQLRLTTLSLQNNLLETLPICLWEIATLLRLNVSYNSITKLADLKRSALTHLNVSGNDLRHLPASLRRATHLEELRAARCRLLSVPKELLELKELKLLNLERNNLGSLPPLRCPSLETLNLDGNQLRKLPSLHHVTQLRQLYVSNNQLQQLPEEINLLPLEHLDISSNILTTWIL